MSNDDDYEWYQSMCAGNGMHIPPDKFLIVKGRYARVGTMIIEGMESKVELGNIYKIEVKDDR